MPDYPLERLGASEFEKLCQSLLKSLIGQGTITFGVGKDGAREATFSGTAPYPSPAEPWGGDWIFQVKFHDIERVGADKARKLVVAELDDELDKITNKYKHRCDNFVLLTNVPFTGVFNVGTIDKVANEVAAKYKTVRNIRVIHRDDINRLLENNSDVRTSYSHLLVAGDLISKLIAASSGDESELQKTLHAYLKTTFNREQYAQLDKAGESADEPVHLQNVFFDLASQLSGVSDGQVKLIRSRAMSAVARRRNTNEQAFNVVQLLLRNVVRKAVLVGGPGEGKSTLGQYLAQLHRAALLRKVNEIALSEDYVPTVPRIPFRIVLKDFAQWLAERSDPDHSANSLEDYICDRVQSASSRSLTVQQLHAVLSGNPTLLILDGLDEVTEPVLRRGLLTRIADFTDRCETVLSADVQILASTRPIGYSEQFDPSRYVHMNLLKLESVQVRAYVERWAIAKNLDDTKTAKLLESIDECLADPQISLLTTTPLQVTILVLIISGGGTPPRQREALFNEYLEVIYKRETSKGKNIIQSEKELIIGLHKYVGYQLHEKATEAKLSAAYLSEEGFAKEVKEYIRFIDPFTPPPLRRKAEESIIKESEQRLVLIVEPVPGEFGFELRSIQEFFAGCHLADTSRDTKQRYERFQAIARLVHWRNVALFFAGRVGRNYSGETPSIVEVCRQIDQDGLDRKVRRGSKLALELAADRAFGSHRRGQRSLLEHGLTILLTEMTVGRRNQIIGTLGSLPPEDIRDHVVPLLSDMITSYLPQKLVNIAYAAHELHVPELARQAVERIALDNPAGALVILAETDFLIVKPSELISIFERVDDSDLRTCLARSSWFSYLTMCSLLFAEPTMNPEKMRSSLSAVLSRGVVLHNDSELIAIRDYLATTPWPTQPDLSLIHGLTWLLYASRLISSVDLESLEPVELKDVPTFIRDGLPPPYTDSNVLAHFWGAHLQFGSPTAESLKSMIEWLGTAEKSEIVRQAISGRGTKYHTVGEAIYDHAEWNTFEQLPTSIDSLIQFCGPQGARNWAQALSELTTAVKVLAADAVSSGDFRATCRSKFPSILDIASRLFPAALIDRAIRDASVGDFDDIGPLHMEFCGEIAKKIATGPPFVGRISALEVIDNLPSAMFSEMGFEQNPMELACAIAAHCSSNPRTLSILMALLLQGWHESYADIEATTVSILPAFTYGHFSSLSYGLFEGFSPRVAAFLAKQIFDEDDKVAEGATAVFLHYSQMAQYYRRSKRFNFPGFADFHRKCLSSSHPRRRLLGIGLFFLREPSARRDYLLLRDFIQTSTRSEEQALRTVLRHISAGTQGDPRWMEMVNALLSLSTRPSIEAILIEHLDEVLLYIEQSLRGLEVDLELPLPLPD